MISWPSFRGLLTSREIGRRRAPHPREQKGLGSTQPLLNYCDIEQSSGVLILVIDGADAITLIAERWIVEAAPPIVLTFVLVCRRPNQQLEIIDRPIEVNQV